MIYFEVTNDVGKVVAGNMSCFSRAAEFRSEKNFSDHVNGIGCKGVYENTDDGIGVWVVAENEKDLLKSMAVFRRTFDLYKEIALGVCRTQKEQLAGTRHILPNIHTQMVQAFDLFTENDPGVFYGEGIRSVLQGISSRIQKKPDDTAHLIVYLNKLVLDMGAHLRGIDVVHFGAIYRPDMKDVRIKAAILHQYTSFAKEFDDAFLKLRVNTINDEATVSVDKNMFSLVMYNILSNALKYCRPESEVRFYFSDEEKILDVSMISLRIEPDEVQDVFREGFRGRHAKTTAGSGVGLFVVNNALQKMKKRAMEILPDYEKTSVLNGEPYVENHFRIDLS